MTAGPNVAAKSSAVMNRRYTKTLALDRNENRPLSSIMRAMVLNAPKQPLQFRDVTKPRPDAGQILMRVSTCAVCRTDLHIVDGELPKPKLPLIPGHEIVGRVEKIGNDVKKFRECDR